MFQRNINEAREEGICTMQWNLNKANLDIKDVAAKMSLNGNLTLVISLLSSARESKRSRKKMIT